MFTSSVLLRLLVPAIQQLGQPLTREHLARLREQLVQQAILLGRQYHGHTVVVHLLGGRVQAYTCVLDEHLGRPALRLSKARRRALSSLRSKGLTR